MTVSGPSKSLDRFRCSVRQALHARLAPMLVAITVLALVSALAAVLSGPADARDKRLPDLTVIKLSGPRSGTTLKTGDALSLAFKVRNRGTAKAKPFTVGAYLSPDRRQGRGDIRLKGTKKVKRLAPRRTARGKLRARLTSAIPPGRYYVLVCADNGRKVREKAERNNCALSRQQVRSPQLDSGDNEPETPPTTQPDSTDPGGTTGGTGGTGGTPGGGTDGGGTGGGGTGGGGTDGGGTGTTPQPPAQPDPEIVTAEAPAPGPTDPPATEPAAIAPPLAKSTATSLRSATSFLYSGPDAIQLGVEPGTIETRRTALIHGMVRNRLGSPLAGVRVSVLGEEELGRTASQEDGGFELVVNGGGDLTLQYERKGYLPTQREVPVPWESSAKAEDVVMIPYDDQASVIREDSTADIQVAVGSPVTDSQGRRQNVVMFERGTDAVMELPDGTERPLDDLRVRSTEYTIGETGAAAMPGELPPQSAYTYAIELSVDEASAAGATDVVFDKPVINYNDNFLGFPAGTPVPAGYYDRETGEWVASKDGIVIDIVGESGGRADLDANGDGNPETAEDLAPIGISDEERVRLAKLYDPGASLWRVEMRHFTPWDLNYPYGPPGGAGGPGQPPGWPDQYRDYPCTDSGSIIQCENQVLGEQLEIAGTPDSLHYVSDRVPGRSAARRATIPVSGSDLPEGLQSIELELEVAGRTFTESLPPAPNQKYEFTWDGRDSFDREVNGARPLKVRIGYAYKPVYYAPCSPPFAMVSRSRVGTATTGRAVPAECMTAEQSFARVGTTPITANGDRTTLYLWQEYTMSVGAWDARSTGLGGWTLSRHHSYDPASRTVFFGDGGRRTADASRALTLDTLAGTRSAGFSGDGGDAKMAGVSAPHGVAVAPDGTVLIADSENNRVRRVTPEGTITTLAGTGEYGSRGDGGPATQATLAAPHGVAAAADGSVFIADTGGNRIRRVAPNGTISTVAGGGSPADALGDGGLARDARLRGPTGVAVAADGSIYVADRQSNRVRMVGTDGRISTIAGDGTYGFAGDGGSSYGSQLRLPTGVAVSPDGEVLIADTYNHRVRRIDKAGRIDTIAGGGDADAPLGDGQAGVGARLRFPTGVAVSPDGPLVVADSGQGRVRRVDTAGIISTIAGGGEDGRAQDGRLATAGTLAAPTGVAVAAGGDIFFSERAGAQVRAISGILSGFAESDVIIPSSSGGELFHFNGSGRHLRTLNAGTGTVMLEFAYDGEGRLKSLSDTDGDTTTIERSESGAATAIVATGGQRTELATNGNGFLSSLTDPAGSTWQFTSSAGGLLETFTTPRGRTSTMTYDSEGRLVKDEDGLGGHKELTRIGEGDDYTVRNKTAMGRETRYRVQQLGTGGTRRTVTGPDGSATTTLSRTDGTQLVTGADGTVVTTRQAPDPRFGMNAAYPELRELETPAGRKLSLTESRSATLSQPTNPLSLQSMTITRRVNGRATTSAYDASTRRTTTTTPEGRQSIAQVNADGRPVLEQEPGQTATEYQYDGRGHLNGTSQGSRSWTYERNERGDLVAVTDSLDRRTEFVRDAKGRITQRTLPDGRVVAYGYDADGNLTSVTPPSRPTHGFSFDLLGRLTSYDPPTLAQPTVTQHEYNADGQPTATVLPGGTRIAYSYNAGGRLGSATAGGAETTFAYDPLGRHSRITTPNGDQVDFTYDGPVVTQTSATGTVNGQVSHDYDNSLRVTSTAVNNSDPIAYSYDGDDRLVQAGALTLQRSATSGSVTGTALGQTADSRSHNSFGELTAVDARIGGTSHLAVALDRDAGGRITRRTETTGGTTRTYDYQYDTGGRLVEVSRDGAVIASYTYDANGNRTGYAATGQPAIAATYDAQDRLLTYGSFNYEHTPAGHRSRKQDTSTGAATTYTHDAYGNMEAVALPDGREVRYVYDGLHRRTAKKVDGSLVEGWLYDGDQLGPVAKLGPSGTVAARFVYGTLRHVPEYMVKDGTTYRFVLDERGSPRRVVDVATGAIVQELDYDEFGNIVRDTNPGFQPFGFAGGLYDPDTELTRFGVRDYDAYTGRFTTKDPLRFDGGDLNLYGYALADPVNYADPTGLFVDTILDGIAIGHGIVKFARDPSWGNAATLGLDIVSAAIPFVPPLGQTVRRLGNYDQYWSPGAGGWLYKDPTPGTWTTDYYTRTQRVHKWVDRADAACGAGEQVTYYDRFR